MSNGLKTQGTQLYFIDSSTTDGPELVTMTCPSGITGLGGARDQVEDTCLDNTDAKTFVAGLANPGTASVPFIFSPQATSHQLLFDLKSRGDTLLWAIGLSDGTAVPTIQSDNDIIVPATRSWFEFAGFVSDVNIDIATNEVVRGTLSIQTSGAVTFTRKTS